MIDAGVIELERLKLKPKGETMRKVVVIGAGAAGMMAAISAAEHGAHTVVLEHKDRVGKKILSTGNGRCNLQILYRHLSVIAVMILSFRGGSSHSLMRKRQWSFSRTSVYMRKTETDISIQTRIRPVRFRFPSHGDGSGFVWKCTQRQKFWKSFRKRTGLSSEPEMGM